MISVVIPTYNRENTVVKSINSVLKQTYSDIEVIIVDDASTDNTTSKIKKIIDKRIKIIELKKNCGATVARNVGIKNANGSYIAFQDSDDYWYPNKLEMQIEFLKMNNSDFIGCMMMSNDGKKKTLIKRLSKTNRINKDDLIPRNFISTQTILAKREVFDKYLFDETIERYQDWDLVLRVCDSYKVNFQDEVLVDQYLQEDSLTKNMEKSFYSLKKIIEKNGTFFFNNKKKRAEMYYLLGLSKRAIKENATPYFYKSFKNNPQFITLVRLFLSLNNL